MSKKKRKLLSFILSLACVLALVLPIKNFGLRIYKNNEISLSQYQAPDVAKDNFTIEAMRIGEKLVDVDDLDLNGRYKSASPSGYPIYTNGYKAGNKLSLKPSYNMMFNDLHISYRVDSKNRKADILYQGSKTMTLTGYDPAESNTESIDISYPSLASIITQFVIAGLALLGGFRFFEDIFAEFALEGMTKGLAFKNILKRYRTRIISVAILGGFFTRIANNRTGGTPLYLFGSSMSIDDMARFISLGFMIALGLVARGREDEKFNNRLARLSFFLNPLLSFWVLELAYNPDIIYMSPLMVLVNYLIIFAIQLLLYLIFRKTKTANTVVLIICLIFGISNDVLMLLRDSPLIPAFLGSLGVAADVAGDTVIEFSGSSLQAFTVGSIRLMAISALNSPRKKISKKRYFIPLASYAGVLAVAIVFSANYYIKNTRLSINLRRPSRTYYTEGSPYSFYRLAVNQMIRPPQGYDAKKVEEDLDEYNNKDLTAQGEKKPNIIIIQSEALADYYKVGDMQTTRDPLEYTKSLKENAIQGHTYVSVLGGGTVNSEYEALTGNTLTFFPDGSYPFQQYVTDGASSIGRLVENQGYETYITHPNKKTNYSREEVWSNLGFENMEFLEAYDGNSAEQEDYAYSTSDMYAHGHVSDKALYEKLIEKFKEKKKDKPFFAFAVSMQNHGSYGARDVGDIDIVGHEGEDPGANEYLNLVKKSDEDFKELVDFFKTYDEPTIICIYGDHQPQNYKYFMDIAYGPGGYGNFETHYTPFTIWANYDIEEESDVDISVNYLTAYLFDKAGLGLQTSAYQNYQLDVMKKYPILTRFNFMNQDMKDVTNDEDFLKEKQKMDSIVYYNVKEEDKKEVYFDYPAGTEEPVKEDNSRSN